MGSGTKRNSRMPRSRKLGLESRTEAEDERRLDAIELGKEVDDLAGLTALEELDAGIVVIRLPDPTLGRGENHQRCTQEDEREAHGRPQEGHPRATRSPD